MFCMEYRLDHEDQDELEIGSNSRRTQNVRFTKESIESLRLIGFTCKKTKQNKKGCCL